eukprot:scaffold21575_cov172-Skeletonema_dohrnii-CCMP3373.AAC.4
MMIYQFSSNSPNNVDKLACSGASRQFWNALLKRIRLVGGSIKINIDLLPIDSTTSTHTI